MISKLRDINVDAWPNFILFPNKPLQRYVLRSASSWEPANEDHMISVFVEHLRIVGGHMSWWKKKSFPGSFVAMLTTSWVWV